MGEDDIWEIRCERTATTLYREYSDGSAEILWKNQLVDLSKVDFYSLTFWIASDEAVLHAGLHNVLSARREENWWTLPNPPWVIV